MNSPKHMYPKLRREARIKAARRRRATNYFIRKGCALTAACALVCAAHHFNLIATVLAVPLIMLVIVALAYRSYEYLLEVSG